MTDLNELADRRLEDCLRHANSIDWVRERIEKGHQFNAFLASNNDEDDEPDDQEFFIGLGPITDCALMLNVTGGTAANMIADALSAAILRANAQAALAGESA